MLLMLWFDVLVVDDDEVLEVFRCVVYGLFFNEAFI